MERGEAKGKGKWTSLRKRPRANIEGARDLRRPCVRRWHYNCPEDTRWRGVFHESSTRMRHEAGGTARVIWVKKIYENENNENEKLKKSVFDAGQLKLRQATAAVRVGLFKPDHHRGRAGFPHWQARSAAPVTSCVQSNPLSGHNWFLR